MQYNQKKSRAWTIVLVAVLLLASMVLGVAAGALGFLWMGGDIPALGGGTAASGPVIASTLPVSPAAEGSTDTSASGGTSVAARDYAAIALPEEMRAMWISFIEWRTVDFSSEEAFRAAVAEMFANSQAMGLNTIVAAVRPFGDALYQSSLFPHSHVMLGQQGQDPGFDPLTIMIEEAHARGLRLEAWINPYRVQHPTNGPGTLAESNPAVQHPEWVRSLGGEMWYDPGVAEVRQLVVDGVLEIVQNYDVDGIHFDDYFYPENATDEFDDQSFATRGEPAMDKGTWRRENINSMLWHVYEALKAANATVSFGVSVQGNNENNYQTMYADVKQWMANTGYVDYVMPQLYWGFAYRTQSGRDNYAFANICAEWAGYPRDASVRLYAGLGAYRIGLLLPEGTREGLGDGGAGDQSEWESGHNLADMVRHLRTVDGFSGFALFRYEYLYQPGDDLSAAEAAALAEALA